MLLIGIGFCAPFLLAFWLAGWVGSVRQAPILGALAGLIGFAVLMTGYVAALFIWVRAQVLAFIETQLPLIIDNVLMLLDRYLVLRDAM